MGRACKTRQGRHDPAVAPLRDDRSSGGVRKRAREANQSLIPQHNTAISVLLKPLGISVDSNEILYCINNTDVTVYAPTATTPSSRITAGINFPSTLAQFGGVLYVANWGVNPAQSTVTVCSLATLALSQTIDRGIGNPLALAVDHAGNLFVVNGAYSTVTVYPAGKTVPSVTISNGIRQPVAIAIAP